MIRVCSRQDCQRAYPVFDGERDDARLCPTCRAGMLPLSTRIGGRLSGEQASEPKARPVELEEA